MYVKNTYKIEVRARDGAKDYMADLTFAEVVAAVRALYIAGLDFRVSAFNHVFTGDGDKVYHESVLEVGDWIPF